MNRNIIGSSLLFFILAAALPLQAQVYVIENATIVPVTSPEIAKGHLVIEDGKIRDFGPRVDRPRSAQRIDATGKFVYPGMIDVNTSLGLADISGIWQTTDNTETAEYSPYLRASQGMNPINRQINVQRFTGVTSAIAVPRGGVISGQEILINLDGWSVEDLTVKDPVAISMVFPTAASANRGRRRAAAQQQGGDPIARAEKQLQDIRELLRKTRNYVKAKEDFEAKKRQTPPPFDMVLVHLVPIVKREIPMTITVNGVEDIRKAMKFVKEENIRAVFVGVSDAYKIADEIAASGIPIVYSQTLQTPGMQEPYDLYYTIPAVLHRAGVTFAFNISSHSNVRIQSQQCAKSPLPRRDGRSLRAP
jgi:imidazolonepropionase-like amidohydrolase